MFYKSFVSLSILLLVFQSDVFSQSKCPSTFADIPVSVGMDYPKGKDLTDKELVFLAKHYVSIGDRMTGFSKAQIRRLKEINPDVKIIKYLNFSTLTPGKAKKAIKLYPDAPLRNRNGHPEPPLWNRKGKSVLFNPANPRWRTRLVSEAKKYIRYGYDGIMADETLMVNSLPDNFSGINPATGKVYTTADFRRAQYRNLKAVKEAIGEDKLLIANSVAYGKKYFSQKAYRFLDVVDGVIAEGFRGPLYKGSDYFFSESDWKLNVDMLVDVNQRGKCIIAHIKYNASDFERFSEEKKRRINLFHLATFLMGKGDRTLFSTVVFSHKRMRQGRGTKRSYDPLWDLKIGRPLGGYYKKDGVYQRDFEYAKVAVNPKGSTYSLRLPGGYRSLSDKPLAQVRMAPHTGAVFLKKIFH